MEDRVKKLETIVTRLSRRQRKTSSAIITPFPISNAVFGEEVKGAVLRYMFPCEGKIVKGAIDLGKKPKQNVTVSISLIGELAGKSVAAIMSKRKVTVEPNIEVSAFDRLTISISYDAEKPENNITEFWVSFLWVPSVKDTVAKSYLIEELENDISKESEGLTEGQLSVDSGDE
jgi:hypothetical protein